MIKTKNSKKKRIGLILCCLFICLCSILCIVPFKQEKVQVSADSLSKNLFDLSYSGSFSSTTETIVSDHIALKSVYGGEYIVINTYLPNYSFTRNNSGDIYTNIIFINLKPNTVYTLSFVPTSVSVENTSIHFLGVYNVQSKINTRVIKSFTTDEEGKYNTNYGIWIKTQNTTLVVKDVQLEEGSNATNYVPYVSDTFTSDYMHLNFSCYDESLAKFSNEIYPIKVSYSFSFDENNILQGIEIYEINSFWAGSIDLNRSFKRSINFEKLNNSYFISQLNDFNGYGYTYSPLLGGTFRDKFNILVSSFSNNGNILMGVPIRFDYSVSLYNDSIYDIVTYYDSYGHSLTFMHEFCKNPDVNSVYYYENYLLPIRSYYYNNDLNLTDNEYYNQGYSAGQTNGYNTGYSVGESAGYNEGFSIGQTTGYNNGYSDGMEDSNQYTFMSLISSTIDAPVKYFQSLFNFELLGVNLQGFLTGLFTLCIIVTIVKLCLGG